MAALASKARGPECGVNWHCVKLHHPSTTTRELQRTSNHTLQLFRHKLSDAVRNTPPNPPRPDTGNNFLPNPLWHDPLDVSNNCAPTPRIPTYSPAPAMGTYVVSFPVISSFLCDSASSISLFKDVPRPSNRCYCRA